MRFSMYRELTKAAGCIFPHGAHNVLAVGDITSHHYILLSAFSSIGSLAQVIAFEFKHTEEDGSCSV